MSHVYRRSVSFLLTVLVAHITPCKEVPQPNDVWKIASYSIDPQHYFAETVANGMIGMLVPAVPFRTQQTELYGAYERLWPGSVSSAVRCFNFLNLAVSIDGERVDRIEQVQQFRQTISFKDAMISTSFDYNGKATITYNVSALRHLPFNALMEVTVIAKRPINLSVSTLMDVPTAEGAVEAVAHPAFTWLNEIRWFGADVGTDDVPEQAVLVAGAGAKGPSGVLSIAAANAFVFDESGSSRPPVTRENGGLTFSRQVAVGTSFSFALVGAAITSAHVADPINEAQRLTASAAIAGTRNLIERHRAAWVDLWKSDVIIQGDDEVQRDLHSMLYHLYSFIREGTNYSIPPMGLTGGNRDYLGHIFWDAETWMFPTLLALKPDLARSILDYRLERLDAARKNAAMHGYRGAQFPWESAATGEEDTWTNVTGGFLEVHITADVALAAWSYYRVTQDRNWLRERGYPLIRDCADYWTSRVTRNTSGQFEIRHVVGADEYASDVDNDAFTNAAAKENLGAAISAARILSLPANPDWETVRSNLSYVTYENGVTREYTNYQGQKTKQADAELLAYPLQAIRDPAAILRDLEYYAPRFDAENGPAMTRAIYTILYQRLGMPEKAYRWFKAGYERNERPPFGVLTESASSNNPYFSTGAGGLVQAILYGFGGLSITDRGLVQVASKLPHAWKSLTLIGIGPEGKTYRIVQ